MEAKRKKKRQMKGDRLIGILFVVAIGIVSIAPIACDRRIRWIDEKGEKKMKKTQVSKSFRRVVKTATLASLLLLFLVSAATAADYVSITPGEANEHITANEDMVILDIRPAEAYNAKHIKDAVCEEELEDIDQYIGKEILVYDDDDTESEDFCGMLAQVSLQGLGFKKIYNLEGGLNAWKEAGFQTVKTRTLTPPLPSFPTSSPTSAPSQASTPVTTSTPVATTPASSPTPTKITTSTTPTPTVSVPSSSSQTPGFEAMPMVIGILIGIVFIKTRKQNIARR